MTTPTLSTTADLLPLLPEMVLVGGAFALLILDLFLELSFAPEKALQFRVGRVLG